MDETIIEPEVEKRPAPNAEMLRSAVINPASFNEEKRTVDVTWTTGAKVRRYDYWRERYYEEELVISEEAIDMGRMNAGASVLNTHGQYDLSQVIGVVERAWIEGGEGRATVRLSERDDVKGYVADIRSGVIRHISVGYSTQRIEAIRPEDRTDGGTDWVYRATRWTPAEISFVPVPADAGSGTRSKKSQEREDVTCEFVTRASTAQIQTQVKESKMDEDLKKDGGAEVEVRAAEVKPAVDNSAEVAKRSADIAELCVRHNVVDMTAELIRSSKDVGEASAKILERLATADEKSGGHRNVTRVQTVRDEHETRMAGISQAIESRVNASVKLDDNGRQFRGMSLLEIGRELLEANGTNTRGMDRMKLAASMFQVRSGMMGTSDFAHIMSNIASKRLQAAYEQAASTYMQWARRAPNAPDFKSMSVVQLSGAPELMQTNEHGEFKYGEMTDGAESYALLTYGRLLSLTRQAIVNDDLRAFDRLTTAFGDSAKRLENRLVYARLTGNANMADGTPLFHADHANLGTGAGSALSFDGLNAMRVAMRKQTGLSGEMLNLTPGTIIVPVALEQTAYQLTSSNYVPATQANTNEFRAGGRTAVNPVVEPLLDASSATAWYAVAQNQSVDTVEYCYLDGADGPVIETKDGWEVDGMEMKCRLDFAAKEIDHRGLYKANGA